MKDERAQKAKFLSISRLQSLVHCGETGGVHMDINSLHPILETPSHSFISLEIELLSIFTKDCSCPLIRPSPDQQAIAPIRNIQK